MYDLIYVSFDQSKSDLLLQNLLHIIRVGK